MKLIAFYIILEKNNTHADFKYKRAPADKETIFFSCAFKEKRYLLMLSLK